MNQAEQTKRRDRGAVLPLVAMALPVLVLMTSFAVDLGRQRALRRDLQANADVIALDLVRLVDGSTSAPDGATTLSQTNNSLSRNELPTVTATDGSQHVLVEWGSWTDPGPTGICPQPILTEAPTCFTAGSTPVNAVRVTLDDELDYFFQPGTGSAERSAVATRIPRSWLQVGSVAAGLQTTLPGGGAEANATVEALNARLGAAFGASIPSPGSVGLDAVSYEGLAATDVDLWRIAQQGGFASPNELLEEELTVAEFFALTAAALDQQAAEGDPNAAAAATSVRELGSEIGTGVGYESSGTIRLGDTIDFSQGGDDAAAAGKINVLDLMSGGADVINGKNFLSYAFNPGIPGVATARVRQFLVQPAQTAFGAVGTTASNKQSAFEITIDVAPLLGMTGPALVPLVVEAATASGRIDAIRCTAPTPANQVDVEVDTSVLKVGLGTANNFAGGNFTVGAGLVADSDFLTISALLQLGLNVLTLGNDLQAQASASLLGANDQLLTFEPDIDPNPTQRAQGGIGGTELGAQLKNTIQAKYGLGLLSSTTNLNLGNQLSYVFNSLDEQVVGPLLTASGLTIGGADVLAFDLDCDSPMLIE